MTALQETWTADRRRQACVPPRQTAPSEILGVFAIRNMPNNHPKTYHRIEFVRLFQPILIGAYALQFFTHEYRCIMCLGKYSLRMSLHF